MIQRKQTLFLLAALILMIICLCFPIGRISPKMMGADAIVYNIGVSNIQFSNYKGWPFMVILLLNCTLCVAAIFTYNRRRLQMSLCTWGEVFCAVWYGYFIYSVLMVFRSLGAFNMNWTACLPLASTILFGLAHHYIKKDDNLVRSADRIR